MALRVCHTHGRHGQMSILVTLKLGEVQLGCLQHGGAGQRSLVPHSGWWTEPRVTMPYSGWWTEGKVTVPHSRCQRDMVAVPSQTQTSSIAHVPPKHPRVSGTAERWLPGAQGQAELSVLAASVGEKSSRRKEKSSQFRKWNPPLGPNQDSAS